MPLKTTLELAACHPVPPVGETMLYKNIVYKVLACDCIVVPIIDIIFTYQVVTVQFLYQLSEGVTLAQAEYFKHSKIRGATGNLKIYYHGTDKYFDQFLPAYIVAEPGFWFAANPIYAASHGSKILQVYLNIVAPLIFEDWSAPDFLHYYNDCFAGAELERHLVFSNAFRAYLIDRGYDGLLYIAEGCQVAIAFYSSQIKAIDNWYPTPSPLIHDANLERYSNTKTKFQRLSDPL